VPNTLAAAMEKQYNDNNDCKNLTDATIGIISNPVQQLCYTGCMLFQ
jgi:hypothetical protein